MKELTTFINELMSQWNTNTLSIDVLSTDIFTKDNAGIFVSAAIVSFTLFALAYEYLNGKHANGKRNVIDWQVSAISFAMASLVQRPFVFATSILIVSWVLPNSFGQFRSFNQEYFFICLVSFLLIDDLLHGSMHYFSHARTPNNKHIALFQKFLKRSHRPHHLHGGKDNKGEMSVAHSPVEHWAFLFLLPNYWFGGVLLYLGFIEVFIAGNIIKTLWVFHVHTNWNYDLYFLTHKNPIIRKTMFALCHVFTFPTQHHHHHSRSKNSAKNMHNLFALYDWLLWKTLVIETERPKIYGWRQSEKEEKSALHRYFANNLK